MKINREHFLTAALMIGAMNATSCKARIGEEATPEGAHAKAVGAPSNESAGPATGTKPIALNPAKEGVGPAKEGSWPAPSAEPGKEPTGGPTRPLPTTPTRNPKPGSTL